MALRFTYEMSGILKLVFVLTTIGPFTSCHREDWNYYQYQTDSYEPADMKIERKEETVTCVFKNSNAKESCQSEFGSCIGIGSCSMKIKAGKYFKISWTSSCVGSRHTITDGSSKAIEFLCDPNAQLTEIVSCYFVGSEKEHKCESSKGSCSAKNNCTVNVKGTSNGKIQWNSSCKTYSTYLTTKIDGLDSQAFFIPCGNAKTSETITINIKNSKKEHLCDGNGYNTISGARTCDSKSRCVFKIDGPTNVHYRIKCKCGDAKGINDGNDETIELDCNK